MSQENASPTNQNAWTIGRLINWTKQYLTENGSDTARLDTEVLLSDVLGCERIMLYTRFEEDPGDSIRSRFRELVKQRAAGCPVAYLVGHKEFFSLKFHVSPDTLIPRPDTEEAIQVILDLVKNGQAAPQRILDIGTGSGILAITLAKELPDVQFVATDLSAEALQVASSNSQLHEVSNRIDFRQGDLLEPVQKQQYDLIVSNPPYVSDSEFEHCSRDVKEYEPHSALVAGPTGMEIYQRLVPSAVDSLMPNGWLVLETSPMLAASLSSLLSQNGFEQVQTQPDFAGNPRIVYGQR